VQLFQRVRLVRMSTTVLAQNDAGIGVKNGINAFGYKNLLGTFAPPFAVINDSAFLDLLPEFGIKYTIDMVPDDQPIPIKVRQGRLISIPYSTEINDIRVMGVRGYPADKWAAMIKACFDQLYREGADNGVVVCMPLHPFVIGQPFRHKYFEQVLEYLSAQPDAWLTTSDSWSPKLR